ncbi:MAG TPA: J domain-containing protein [Acidimicrobiales bacterium]|nr:J domain-containing protein [Acidimicrobiales bacterium]
MDREEAARLLGVAPSATPEEARVAFRALIRARHPDRAGTGATADAARLIEAHRVLRTGPAPGSRPGPPPPEGRRDEGRPGTARTPVDTRVDGDALLVDAEPATVMARLVEAGHALGEITYLDRSSGFVELLLLVQDEGDPAPAAVSLVASLQRRQDAVEVFCTVERLDGHPAPPVAPLVAALAAEMAGPA